VACVCAISIAAQVRRLLPSVSEYEDKEGAKSSLMLTLCLHEAASRQRLFYKSLILLVQLGGLEPPTS
jgi:hypothetical protein